MARKGGSGEDWMTTTTTTAAGLLLGWMGRRDASEWDSAREGDGMEGGGEDGL